MYFWLIENLCLTFPIAFPGSLNRKSFATPSFILYNFNLRIFSPRAVPGASTLLIFYSFLPSAFQILCLKFQLSTSNRIRRIVAKTIRQHLNRLLRHKLEKLILVNRPYLRRETRYRGLACAIRFASSRSTPMNFFRILLENFRKTQKKSQGNSLTFSSKMRKSQNDAKKIRITERDQTNRTAQAELRYLVYFSRYGLSKPTGVDSKSSSSHPEVRSSPSRRGKVSD